VRVDAAVRDEPQQVDVATALARPCEGRSEREALEERPVLDRLAHAHEVLVQDAARPDREVAHLGIAHLPVREPDGGTGGRELRVGIALEEAVEDGSLGQLHGVPGPRRREAPAIEDHERYELDRRDAIRQVSVKDVTSSDAPGLTDPP
jgi:hypothetical protein